MRRLLTTGIMLATTIAAMAAVAAIEVHPDARVIDENGTLHLTIRLDGSMQQASPDLGALARDFEIVSRQSASQLRSINGNVESWTEWTLTLRPRRTGTLEIPSLTIDGARSQPIAIEVRPLDVETRRLIESLARFEVEHQPSVVYVQAQLTVTRRLTYAEGTQLYGELPGLPEIDGAVVQAFGDADHHTELRDGRRVGVIEQRFLVFPERSGPLTVPGATIMASVVVPRRAGGRSGRTELRVASQPLTIDVLPVPSSYPRSAPWLPARAVAIDEEWPTRGAWAVGDPRARTLIVRAAGGAASRIAPLTVDYPPSLKVYPEAPVLDEQSDELGVVGMRTETVRLIPTEAGAIRLPAVEVVWWNTELDRLQRTQLPPRNERTYGASIAKPAGAPDAAAVTMPPQVAPSQSEASAQEPVDAPPRRLLWTVIGALAAIAAVATAVAVAAAKMHSKSAVRGRRPSEPIALRDLPRSERAMFRALRRAVRSGSARAMHDALAAWLTIRHGDRMRGLERFAGVGGAQLAQLDERLYGNVPDDAFDGTALWRAARMHRHQRRTRTPPPDLPALYPSRAT